MAIFKKDGKWWIDYYYQGKRKRRAIGPYKKDAENALAAVKADIVRGEYKFKRDRKIRFDEMIEKYKKYAKANKKNSLSRDEISLENLKTHFGDKIFSKITPWDIEEYKEKRLKDKVKGKKKERTIRPATINRELALLKHMFNLAIKWKLVDENPVKEVRLYRERKLEMKILTRKEISRLINQAPNHLKPVLIIALNTGMRKGEILNLRWGDIDFEKEFIFIKESKSGKQRKVPMNSLVAKTLNGLKRESEFVFYNLKTKTKIRDVKTAFKSACEKAEIEDLRFHDLRHTAATFMVQAGVDIVTVKEILGYSSIQMTMRYAHPTPENKRKAVNALGSIFGKKGQVMDTIWTPKGSEEAKKMGLSNLITVN